MANDFRRDAIPILNEHLGDVGRDVERQLSSVLHLASGKLQGRGRAYGVAKEQMSAERKCCEILQPQRHVGEKSHCERSLRLRKRVKIRLLAPFYFRPQPFGQVEQALQCCRVIELA